MMDPAKAERPLPSLAISGFYPALVFAPAHDAYEGAQRESRQENHAQGHVRLLLDHVVDDLLLLGHLFLDVLDALPQLLLDLFDLVGNVHSLRHTYPNYKV